MMQHPIQVSVALVTRNGADRLERCLQSLRGQSVQPFEVVVSDDSDPEQAHLTKEVAERYGCRYIEGPRRGLYANRNRAAIACTGTHVRTMDDDHVLPPGHLALCLESIKSDPEAIWTTGEIGFIDGKYYAHAEIASQLHPSGVGISPENPDENWAIADGSTTYPATIFRKGLLMFEGFRYGSSYLEFGAYLHSQGFVSRCIKDALVEHYATQSTLDRLNGSNREQLQSMIFASLAYNLFFKRSLLRASYMTAKIVFRSGFDPLLFKSISSTLSAVNKRWGKIVQGSNCTELAS